MSAPSPSGISRANFLGLLCGPFAFSVVGGYGDAAGYVLADTFTGHVTGALVLAAISVAGRHWNVLLLRGGGIVCFLVGVFLAAAIVHLLPATRARRILTIVMAIEIVLVLLGYVGMSSGGRMGQEWLVACLSLTLGLQNGVWHKFGGVSVHTTFLTGLLISLVSTKTEEKLFTPKADHGRSDHSGTSLSLGVWAAFVGGAILGAVAALHFHALGITGAAILLFVMLIANACMPEQAAAP